MAYNPYATGYQPSYYPTFPTLNYNQPTQNQNNGNSNLIYVQGEAGAKAYLTAPNTSILLLDSESPVLYLKTTDSNGLPTLKIMDYTVRDNSPTKVVNRDDYATRDDISHIRKEIDEINRRLATIKERTHEHDADVPDDRKSKK